jgi:signal transduction histidine kinase
MPVERFPGCRGPELHPGLLSSQIEELIVEVFQTGVAIRDVELSTASLDANGLKRCYLMNFYPVRTNDQAIRWVGVIAVNITDRLLSEEALRKTEKLAATGRLAASIAHEVNNPLEAVTNILYLLQTDEHLSQAASDWLETAQSELARVSEITQQTLRFYRQSTSPARVNASELMDSVIRLYQPRLQRAGVVVRRKYLEVEPVAAYGGELRQVFANLMGNALDAMPHGGDIVVSTREGCGRAADGSWSRGVRITVSDSGCGMSALTLQRIFEPFFTTKEATGTGLGLWLSSEIVRKHGGVIRVRSAQTGRCGSTFSLFLPRNSAPDTVLE